MNNTKKGDEYEDLVHTVFRALVAQHPMSRVSMKAPVETSYGPVIVDVLIEHFFAGTTYKTIIECKNYRRRVNPDVVRNLATLVGNAKASKGIVVSASGFTDNTKRAARENNIELLRASKGGMDRLTDKTQLPVAVVMSDIRVVGATLIVPASRPQNLSSPMRFNDLQLDEVTTIAARNGVLRAQSEPKDARILQNAAELNESITHEVGVGEALMAGIIWIEDAAGNKHVLNEASLLLNIQQSTFLSDLSLVEASIHLENVEEGQAHVILPFSTVEDFASKLESGKPVTIDQAFLQPRFRIDIFRVKKTGATFTTVHHPKSARPS